MGGDAMIEGKLINLRAQEVTDLDRLYAWINDREVTRFLSMRYQGSYAAEEAWVRDRALKAIEFGDVHFAIETKDGVHIGSISFHGASPENRRARLGVMIGDKAYWSRGYGTDAIVTLLRFAFDEMNLHRVDLTVDVENERAIACYRKCGFVEEVRLRRTRYGRGRYGDQLIMGILRDEFSALWGGGGRSRRRPAR
jgi:RimJ/RimL family protein N-acetyltransferase